MTTISPPDVQRRRRPAGMQAAAMEPGAHVHRPVHRREGKMHGHVVRRQHVVDTVQRHALRPAGRAGRVQARRLVVNMMGTLDRRVRLRAVPNVFGKRNMAFRRGSVALQVGHDDAARLVLRHRERPLRHLPDFRVVDVDRRPAVVEDERRFPGRQPEVDRAVDHPDLLRRQVAQHELGGIEKLVDDDVVLAHIVLHQRVRQPVRLAVQLGVRPRPIAQRTGQRRTVREPVHVAQKPVQVREFVLERVLEHANVVRPLPLFHGILPSV